jgi:hypothetical protein
MPSWNMTSFGELRVMCENARLIVSKIVLNTLEGLKISYPKTSGERRDELLAIRKQLEES